MNAANGQGERAREFDAEGTVVGAKIFMSGPVGEARIIDQVQMIDDNQFRWDLREAKRKERRAKRAKRKEAKRREEKAKRKVQKEQKESTRKGITKKENKSNYFFECADCGEFHSWSETCQCSGCGQHWCCDCSSPWQSNDSTNRECHNCSGFGVI